MYNRNDPRFRRTLNQISQNLESANESAQVGLFSLSENYIKPCFSSVAAFVEPCTTACLTDPRDRAKRYNQARGARPRGRLEHSFDFYDDWEDDETDALLSLEDDEFDRVVGGYGTTIHDAPQSPIAQPGARHRNAMQYGTRGSRARRRSTVLPYDVGPDPTVIPNQSYFGFLSSFPFRLAGRGLRYKPSAADLQDRTQHRDNRQDDEMDALLEGEEDDDDNDNNDNDADNGEGHAQSIGQSGDPSQYRTRRRRRRGTTGSEHTADSFSSRGDIFPSDDEDDAVALDDEFTIALERRTTNPGHDDTSSGGNARKTSATSLASSQGSGGGVGGSASGSRSARSSQKPKLKSKTNKSAKSRKSSSSTTPRSHSSDPEMGELPSISALKHEEHETRAANEENTEKNRVAAQSLAVERGLAGTASVAETEAKVESLNNETETHADEDRNDSSDGARPVVRVADGPIQLQDNEQAGDAPVIANFNH